QLEEQVLDGDRDAEDLASFRAGEQGGLHARASAYLALRAFTAERPAGREVGAFLILQLPLERFSAPASVQPAPPAALSTGRRAEAGSAALATGRRAEGGSAALATGRRAEGGSAALSTDTSLEPSPLFFSPDAGEALGLAQQAAEPSVAKAPATRV